MYGEGTWLYASDVQQNGRLLFGYPYMPLTLLATSVAQWLAGDYRYAQLLAMSVTALLIATARPSRTATMAAIAYLFWPRTFFALEQGWTEPILVMLLAGVVFCALRLPRATPWVLGLLLAGKQYTPAVLLVAPVLMNWRRPDGSRVWASWVAVAWRAAVAAAVVTLPLVLASPRGFWNSAVALQFKQPFRFDALSFLAWMSDATFEMGKAPIGEIPPLANWLCFVALLAGVGLALWRLRRAGTASPEAFAASVALMFLLFFAFNKQAFANYYYFVAGALAVAIGAGRWTHAEPEPVSPANK
jgi:hypothetical protein